MFLRVSVATCMIEDNLHFSCHKSAWKSCIKRGRKTHIFVVYLTICEELSILQKFETKDREQCSSCHGKNRLNDGVRNCVSQWVHEKKERNRDTCWVQNHDISISGFLESYEKWKLSAWVIYLLFHIFCYHNHHFRSDRVLMVVFLNHDNFLNSCFVLLGAFIIIFLQLKE